MRPALFLSCLLLGCLACSGESEPSAGRVILGRHDDPEVSRLLSHLSPGVVLQGRIWNAGGHRMRMDGALLVAVFDDPERPGERVTLGVASDPMRLEEARDVLVAGTRPALEFWRLGERVMTARLTPAGVLRAETLRSYEQAQGLLGGSHLKVRYLRDPELDETLVQGYVERALSAVQRAGWAGIEVPVPLSLVARGRLAAHEPLARFDALSGTLFAALTGAGDDGGHALVRALLLAELGPPREAWLADVAAAAATGTLLGRPLSVWSDHGPPSPQRGQADRAQAWRRLAETYGPEELRTLWLAPPSLKWDGQRVESQRATWSDLPSPWRDGLILRTYVPARPGPERGETVLHEDLTLEGDMALLVDLWRAEAAGVAVALEVALLSSPSGTFDGARTLTRPEEWREHFEHRARAVAGIGPLAFAGGVDMLVLGAGAPRVLATRWIGEGEETPLLMDLREARIEGWGRVIKTAIESYSGLLGLSTLIGRETEMVGLWDEVDVMLLRLRQPPSVDRSSLEGYFTNRLEQAGALAAAAGRPAYAVAEGFEARNLEVLLEVGDKLFGEGGGDSYSGLGGLLVQ